MIKRQEKIERFKREYPQFKNLSDIQIEILFRFYLQNLRRNFDGVSNISFLVAGTLVILITSLFVNVGSQFNISNGQTQPNKIVMNSIISSASSGLLIALTNQYTNVFWDDAKR